MRATTDILVEESWVQQANETSVELPPHLLSNIHLLSLYQLCGMLDTMLPKLNLVIIQHVHLLPSIAGREYCKSVHTWPTHQHEEHFRLMALCAELHAATCTLGPSLPRGKPAAMPKDSDTNFTTNTLRKWKLLFTLEDLDQLLSLFTIRTPKTWLLISSESWERNLLQGNPKMKCGLQLGRKHTGCMLKLWATKPPGDLNNSKWSFRTTSPEAGDFQENWAVESFGRDTNNE